MTRTLIALLIALALVPTGKASAQESGVPMNLGFYGGANFNMHTPSYKYLLSPNEYNFNDNIISLGLNAGLIGNFPISDMFTFSARLGFNSLGAELKGKDMADVPVKLDATLYYFEVTPALQIYNLIPVDYLYLLAGFEVGIPVTAKYALNSEPVGGTSTNVIDEDLPGKSLRAALALGLGYTFKLSDNVFLTPEASFRLPFTNISANSNFDKWTAPQVRAGIALTFGFGSDEKKPEMKTTSTLNAGFRDIRYFEKDGTPRTAQKITLEEVQYTELFPLIPYIFFNENSPEPSPKTQVLSAGNEAGKFSLNALEPDAQKINSQTLDIIGTRMQANPNSRITITGTNDNRSEAKNSELSKTRAEFAKNYLIVNYGITPNRITVEQRGLPAKPSTSAVPEGIEENRRVEFSSSSRDITAPILVEKEKHTYSEPNPIQFIPFAESSDEIVEWEFQIAQAGRVIKKEKGIGEPDEFMWNIAPNDLTASAIPVEYSLFVRNAGGKTDTKTGTLPVDFISSSRKKAEERPDKIVSKFSLMLFDFDSPEVSSQDMELINQHILPAIKYNSTVQVFGYTDIIGDDAYNKKLALKRAMNVMQALQSKANSAKYETYGVGESVQIFNNNTPVGRQLSRTVQVYVVTPKE